MLYHISSDLDKLIPIFTPRIPNLEQRIDGENDTIPRICVAKSIEDCLTAMPDGGYYLSSRKEPNIKRVYEFDEKFISKENIILPNQLYFSELVLDAWVTGEHWIINQTVKPLRVYDIEIMGVKVIDAPFIHPNEVDKIINELNFIYDVNDILDELENRTNRSVARITDLNYNIVKELII